jgi:serine-type D-Ala-D-Ala carboxypeptidase/endopeptidase (penicillin-binding protein 4)
MLAALTAACHSTPRPTAAPRAVRPTLAATIERLLAVPELSHGTFGVSIRSLDRGEDLYSRNADTLLTPASTLKLVTLAAAADRLGWSYRYTTTLYRTGAVRNGTLDGHLLVVGSGDPSLDDWDGAASARFTEWAIRLRDAGIGSVAGHVIGDDNAFDDDGLGSGWMWDDTAASYSAPVSGLQFNENSARIIVTPTANGEPPQLRVEPSSAPVLLRNMARTEPGGRPLQLLPEPRSPRISVVGSVDPASAPVTRLTAVSNPTLYFANALRAALIANGVRVDRYALDGDDYPPADLDSAVSIGEINSAPLTDLARTMMAVSQNLFAESLLKTLGREVSGGPGTAAGGVAATLEQLTAWGVPRQALVMVDGSGLSRYNLITPSAQVAVLAHIYGDPRLRDAYLAALPVAGTPGTLERRLLGTAAANNARIKTGSLSNARGIAGFVRTRDGEMLAFSILANNFNAPGALVDRASDGIITALAEFMR